MEYPRIGTLEGATERDDGVYLDFVEGVKAFAGDKVLPTLKSRYGAIEADYASRTGRKPATMDEIKPQLDALPILAVHRRLFRTTQEMRGVGLTETYGKRQEEMIRELAAYERRGPGRLILDPTLQQPEYARGVHFHIQPGGYNDHPLAGYIYHYGTNILWTGGNNHDEKHQSMVNDMPLPRDGRANRVLDLACAAGQSTTAWKRRLPNAEVWGADSAAPMLRYAHKRAAEMGLDVTFAQMLAEQLKFPDGYFDIVYVFILFHEVPTEVGRQVLREIHRVLRPGGVIAVLDVGKAKDWSPLDAYLRDFIIRDNAEPYEREWAYWDFPAALREAGFRTEDENPSQLSVLASASSAHHGRWIAERI